MTKKNASASVKQRLLNLSRKTGEDFQLLLTRYAIERLLHRLSVSNHRDVFILKGAMLFALWTGQMHRPTRDLDLLGFGEPGGEGLKRMFAEVCRVESPGDGLVFDAESVTMETIREDQEYGGQRIKVSVTLVQARVSLQVDVGFGDAVTPAAVVVDYPSLLGMECSRLRAYPKETVVAEKLEAIVQLGFANTRMKDFYDLLVISRTFSFDGEILCEAIAKTFRRRGTELPPATPVGLSGTFARDPGKQTQWKAFLNRSGLSAAESLEEVVTEIATFLGSPLACAAGGEIFTARWESRKGWASR